MRIVSKNIIDIDYEKYCDDSYRLSKLNNIFIQRKFYNISNISKECSYLSHNNSLMGARRWSNCSWDDWINESVLNFSSVFRNNFFSKEFARKIVQSWNNFQFKNQEYFKFSIFCWVPSDFSKIPLLQLLWIIHLNYSHLAQKWRWKPCICHK